MNKPMLSLLALAAIAAPAATSLAGNKYASPTPVTIDLAQRHAYGVLSAVRNSNDVNSKIGCSYNSNGAINCSAVDATASKVPSCSIVNPTPAQVQVVSNIHGDSYLFFSWDEQWKCNYILVENGSQFPPKAP